MLVSSYNDLLVVGSLVVAILACYTALDMAGRISTVQGRAAHCWLAGGAFAMGTGIWAMHFIGMLAFNLPIPLGYDPAITLLSLLIAVLSSALVLWLVSQETLPFARLALGAMIIGLDISGMHYTGMAAMQMNPAIQYIPSLFVLSILIAIVASGAALWIVHQLRQHSPRVRLLRIGAAAVMGGAIVSMHYTGMAAAQFPVGSICGAVREGFSTGWLSLIIIVITLSVLAIALITSVLDLRLEARTSKLSSSLSRANQELTYLALHDNLTKLPNRMLLDDRLNQAIQNTAREKGCFALMFIDLDGFKAVNDAYGHHVGDLLLFDVARRIEENVRVLDTIARVGGDEFVLLAKVGEPADAATIADKLLTAIREPFQVAGHELRVSGSIGIAMYPGDGERAEPLLTNADAAMYHSKNLGRNVYSFFEASMNANVHEQQLLVQDLRSAIDKHELVLHYQPKLDSPSGLVKGVEALVRWVHPTRGLIAPDQFIPLAEKTGLIVPIGKWVLDTACQQMKKWHDAGHSDWTVAVNLSALQFTNASLIPSVCETLRRHALQPSCLTLEITESTAMRDVEASLAILQQLHGMGVRISIDDFGTGYSSLLYLKRLPASELKIDRGFIRDLAGDTEDAAIVSAIVALGHTLNMSVVAEGVETVAQQEFLTRLGCDSMQGYLLGRPMTADLINVMMHKIKALAEPAGIPAYA